MICSPDERPLSIPFARPQITSEDVEAVERVLRSGWLTTGSECLAFEGELAEYLGAPHVVAVSSCTAALEIAFAWMGLPPGARVGVPTWTFASTGLAPFHQGARLVLLDVDLDTLNLSPRALEAALHDGLDAVVAVHFAGVPVDPQVHDLCRSYDVPLVEDAAHALGASDHRGRIAGAGSTCAAFSFYATKNLSAAEGGALVTDHADMAQFARSFRLHGLSADAWARYEPGGKSRYDVELPGIKANMPDILAALARSQLARFEELQARRRAVVTRYRDHLSRVRSVRPVPDALTEHGADHLFIIVLPEGVDRRQVLGAFEEAAIGVSVHFRPLHQFSWFKRNADLGPTGVSTADSLAERVISLPLHACLTDSDVDRVCEVLETALIT